MTNQPLTPPVAPTDPSQPKQDPLAVLQDILVQAKNKSGTSAPAGGAMPAGLDKMPLDLGEPAVAPAKPTVDPAIEAAQKAEQEARDQAENLRKQQELEQQILAQKAIIATEMQTSTQEKARLEQKQEEADASQSGIAHDPGFAIHQIDHDKAPL